MIELENFRKKILISLNLEKSKFIKIKNKKHENNVNVFNTNVEKDFKNSFLLNESELKDLSIKLIKIGKINEALEVSFEIEDAEYLWLDHYDQMIKTTIEYCVKNLDFNIFEN